MLVIEKVDDLKAYLNGKIQNGDSIGFVPTMGALHAGHGSLIQEARKNNAVVVASVFVNPTQFNNPDDLLKYPRTVSSDVELLASMGCDVLFLPSVEEIYSSDYVPPILDLGRLDQVMEGALRPGHFNGVVQVVYRLFDLVSPTNAYFGLKDFQQVAVIKYMVKTLNLAVNIVACPILRNENGLALSSRNMRLSAEDKNEALHIFRTLMATKSFAQTHTPVESKLYAEAYFAESEMELEYFEIVHPLTLEVLTTEWVDHAIACIVAYCGDVRLIDNMELN